MVLKEVQLLSLLLKNYSSASRAILTYKKYSKLLRYVIGLLGAPYRALVSGSLLLLTQILCRVMELSLRIPEDDGYHIMDPNNSNYPLARLMSAKLFDSSHFPRTIKLVSDLLLTCVAQTPDEDSNNTSVSNHSFHNANPSDSNSNTSAIRKKSLILTTETLQVLKDLSQVFKEFTLRKQTTRLLSEHPVSFDIIKHLINQVSTDKRFFYPTLVMLNSMIKAGRDNSYDKIKRMLYNNDEIISDSGNILSEVVDLILGTIDDHQYTRSIPLHLRQSLNLTAQTSDPKMIYLLTSISECGGGWWLESKFNRIEAAQFIVNILDASQTGILEDKSQPLLIENPIAMAKEIMLVIGGQVVSFSKTLDNLDLRQYYRQYIQDVFWCAVPLFDFLTNLVTNCKELASAFIWWMDGQSDGLDRSDGLKLMTEIDELNMMKVSDLSFIRELVWPMDYQILWEAQNDLNENDSSVIYRGKESVEITGYEELNNTKPYTEKLTKNQYRNPIASRASYARETQILLGLAGVKLRNELFVLIANVYIISKLKANKKFTDREFQGDSFNEESKIVVTKRVEEMFDRKEIEYLWHLKQKFETFPFAPSFLYGQSKQDFIINRFEISAFKVANLIHQAKAADDFMIENGWKSMIEVMMNDHGAYVISILQIAGYFNKTFDVMENELVCTRKDIDTKDVELSNCKKLIKGKDREIFGLNSEAGERDKRISILEREASERDIAMNEKAGIILELNSEIEGMKEVFAKMQADIEELKKTKEMMELEVKESKIEQEELTKKATEAIQNVESKRASAEELLGIKTNQIQDLERVNAKLCDDLERTSGERDELLEALEDVASVAKRAYEYSFGMVERISVGVDQENENENENGTAIEEKVSPLTTQYDFYSQREPMSSNLMKKSRSIKRARRWSGVDLVKERLMKRPSPVPFNLEGASNSSILKSGRGEENETSMDREDTDSSGSSSDIGSSLNV
ncbi:hypothetical protein AYI68_g413 [Smittium mucronatum]|uniref:Uncharacterized protein n=1 Tax=Smittium mucronatum TaxID=133383 RepID=A0A1R0H8B6_9FUNG|nr:hypothetical protein AYI68_g413 [Smittium mucronatum]